MRAAVSDVEIIGKEVSRIKSKMNMMKRSHDKCRVKAEKKYSTLLKRHNRYKQRTRLRMKIIGNEKKGLLIKLADQEKASNKYIKGIMDEADMVIDEARIIREEADKKTDETITAIVEEQRQSILKVREERRTSSRLRTKEVSQLSESHRSDMLELELAFDCSQSKLQKKLSHSLKQIQKERVMWHKLSEQFLLKSNIEKLNVSDAKKKGRAAVQKQMDKAFEKECHLQKKIDDLTENNFNLMERLQMANKAKRMFKRQKDSAIKQASARLMNKIDLEGQNKLLFEELLEISRISEERRILLVSYDAKPTVKAMQKVWLKGKRGGTMWEIWVVQLVCELLIIGVPPSTIPSTIYTVYDTLYGIAPKEVPSVNYVRQCRTVVQVIGETISAIKLGQAADWVQMSFDGTTRRHIPFQCLIISIMKEEYKVDPVIVSSCIFLDNETADCVTDSLFNKVCQRV